MSELFELEAQTRTEIGTAAMRRLRREDHVPAVVYGAGKESSLISLMHKDVLKALGHEAVYSHILTIKTNGKSEKVVLKDLLRHPSKPKVLHMDFLRVRGKDKLTMNVPLHFEGEEEAPGVEDGGVLSKLTTELEISCLPADLPEYIVVDISKMEIGDSIHLSEVTLPKGVSFLHALDDEHDHAVVSIHAPKMEPVEEESEEETPETVILAEKAEDEEETTEES